MKTRQYVLSYIYLSFRIQFKEIQALIEASQKLIQRQLQQSMKIEDCRSALARQQDVLLISFRQIPYILPFFLCSSSRIFKQKEKS